VLGSQLGPLPRVQAGGWGSAPAEPEEGAPVPSDGIYASHIGDWPDVEVDHAAVITHVTPL
jgi:hypothetical protein